MKHKHSGNRIMGGVAEAAPMPHQPAHKMVPAMGSDAIKQYGNATPSQFSDGVGNADTVGDASTPGVGGEDDAEPAGSDFSDRPAVRRNKQD